MPGVAGPIIGGGIGLLGSMFGKKDQTSTVTNQLDPATQQYLQYMRGMAQNQYNGLPMPNTSGYQQYANAGQGALGILGGDPRALGQAIQPGMQQLNQIYNLQQGEGLNALHQAATLAGGDAGGGISNTRAQIPIGSFMAQMGAARAQGALGLMGQAYQNANSLANLGMGANYQLSQLPLQYAQGRMGLLQQGFGPYSQSSTQVTPTQTNPFAGLLGGALAGAGISGMGGYSAQANPNMDGYQLGQLHQYPMTVSG